MLPKILCLMLSGCAMTSKADPSAVESAQTAQAETLSEPVFAELGKKYGKTPAQVILRWHTQMGFVVIPGSKNVDNIRDNLDILDFRLTE